MKNSKDKNQPVTAREFQEFKKGDFQKLSGEVKELSGEVKQLGNDFQEFAEFITSTAATKDDLKETELRITRKMDTAVRVVVKEEMHPLREEMREWKNEILKSNDKVVKKLDHVITEQAAHFVGHRRMDETLLEHGSDIKNLKHRVGRLETEAGVV